MITTTTELNDLIDQALKRDCIAIDTEFVWERTYYPDLALIQVALSPEECFLIDVPAVSDLSRLGEVLSNPKIVKILHDAQQDLTILRRATGGAYPVNIFDTRCAAGFAGLPSTISLFNLLKELFQVELDKSETRTNWLQRPLTQRQLDYAIEDICHLHQSRDTLLSRARELGRESWLQEEMATYDDPVHYHETNPRHQFRRIKGSGGLNCRQLAVLRELTVWREEEARKQGRPRQRILYDETLLDLSVKQPDEFPRLKRIRKLYDRTIRSYGVLILEMIEKGQEVPDQDCPTPPKRPENFRTLKSRVDPLLAFMREKGENHQLDPALLASRSDMTSLVIDGLNASPDHHRLLRGWRNKFIGQDLLNLIADQTADPA